MAFPPFFPVLPGFDVPPPAGEVGWIEPAPEPASVDADPPAEVMAVAAVTDMTDQNTKPATTPRCSSSQPTQPRRDMTG